LKQLHQNTHLDLLMNNQPVDKLKTEIRNLVSEVNATRGAASRFKSQLKEAMDLLDKAHTQDGEWHAQVQDLHRRVSILI
jgi:hypothetical protein